MRFKFTNEKGDTYCVEVVARREGNSRSTKKATYEVAGEIANLFSCAAYYYEAIESNNMYECVQRNVSALRIARFKYKNNIIESVKK